jgi:hypothetical protein
MHKTENSAKIAQFRATEFEKKKLLRNHDLPLTMLSEGEPIKSRLDFEKRILITYGVVPYAIKKVHN